ncbi:MAG: FtsX-like permease family protein [Luteitalea sp.]|nr:FtsX-like permease family protein [Luteitalea sp.]
MRFIVRMALREVRASWQRLLFFFACIAVGVASIVAIRSVIQSVGMVLTSEARALLAADMMVRSNSPFTPAVHEMLAREQRAGRITAQSEAIEIDTMVRTADAATPVTKMIELRAVQEGFPFHGTLTLSEGTYSHALLRNGGALVRPELLAHLDVEVGDHILIGARSFELRGVIASEPGRSLGVFTLGPRVFIDHADLPSTGLLAFGSDIDYEMLLKVPDAALGPLTADLEAAFVNEYVGIRSYRRRQDRMAENLIRTENYLSLVGLVVLLLGGIGVSSVTRVFVQQKIRSIAILKCVGCTSRQVLAIYLTQVLLLGLAGSALGVALAAAVISALPLLLSGVATVLLQVDIGLTRGAVAQGVAVGLLVSLLFSLVPLLEVRQIKPALLLRQDTPPHRRFDWNKWVVTALVAAALVGVASWQAGSIDAGLLLTGGFVAVALVLDLTGVALVRAVRPLRHSSSFALRHAVLHVTRPGNQTRVILLAVGLGSFFILTVQGIQVNLLRDFSVQLGEDTPDILLLDVQRHQQSGLNDLLDRESGSRSALRYIPVLRARIVGLRGRDVGLESYGEVRGRGGLSREFTITYRPNLEANERLVAGEWWDGPSQEGQAEVSIEESLQRRFDIQLGDEMRFDVLGRIVAARVTSFREVDFRDFRAGGFVIVFRPGPFDNAPHSFIASLKGPTDIVARARMHGSIVTRYPNLSVIDLREVLDAIQGVVNTVTPAVRAIGLLVLLSGSLILVGAISMTKFRRVYEAAILKTLGATSRLIAAMLVLEYGVLGAMAGTIGAFGAAAFGWAAARYVLDLSWEASPLITVNGIGATTVLVSAIGVLASLGVIRHKPLATLRAE